MCNEHLFDDSSISKVNMVKEQEIAGLMFFFFLKKKEKEWGQGLPAASLSLSFASS